ncbi:GldG family protein [Spirochaeta thermophila]|uniref:Uncharacterized protein n=1 Tax=Winmispira thermophila (strain ATCC 49972 / DSM 6192 / RI 19.B1) TaxID=665571 RepID=E0RN80_WINT6|nr:GldG family protein [Spirochaeta thermophila]ADN02549.1 hypothetical protein STHERM_c16090 [Spirochaeta thermophila DSM 6192]
MLLAPLPLPSGLAALLATLSPAAHLLRLTDGLLDLRDLAYFLGGSVLGLLWAIRLYALRRGPVRTPHLFPLAVLALLLTIHGLLTPLSLDLTTDRRHTLGPASRTLLSRIVYPLTITYYTSRRLAAVSPTPSEVEDLLRLYTRANPRIRVKIETVDERRMEVEDLGIVPQQIQITEAGEIRYLTVYSGLTLTYLDRIWTLPVVYSADRLEYELACGLRALIEDRRPVVGILARTTGESYQTTYRNLVGVAARTFGVRAVDPASTSLDEIDLLLVIDDGRLTEEDIRFVLTAKEAGIPLMLCVDAVRVDPDAGFRAGRVEGSPLLALLEGWGVELEPALVAQRPGLLLPVVEEGESSSVRTLHPYPLWWEVPLPGMPHPITSVLRSLHLYWASPLTLTEAWRPLLLSSPEAWLVTDPLTASPTSGRVTAPPSGARRGPFVLAAVTEGPPRVLVLGDAEAGSDLVEFTHAVGNLDFFLASFHWLLGQEDMLTLVTRTRTVPLLDLPEEPERARIVLHVLDALAVGVVPGLLLLLSFVLALRRPHAED